MSVAARFRLVIIHGVLFGILAFLSFLGALTLYVQFMPSPVASALADLNYFAPIMGVGALVLGFVQAALDLWLYKKNRTVFWIINIILALIFGGLASFFAIWIIWTVVTLINLFLVWVFTILMQREMNKAVKDMPS